MGELLKYILLLAALVTLVLAAAHWRRAIIAAMVLVVFEGALRKWVLPEAQTMLYLAKDVLLLGAYSGFILTHRRPLGLFELRPLAVLLGLTAAYGAMQMFNPAIPILTLGLVGWKSYFFYTPLIVIVPHLFDEPWRFERGLWRYALLCLPIAGLGALQFYSPVESPINLYLDPEASTSDIVAFGIDADRARVAGTFAFISGYTAFLTTAALLVAGLLATRIWEAKASAILYVTLGAILVAMLATGSRAGIYSLIAVAPIYMVFSLVSGDMSAKLVMRMSAGILAVGGAIFYFLPEPVDAFTHRATGSDDTTSRVVSPMVEPFMILEDVGAFGFGIGASHQSASFLVGDTFPWWTNGIYAEAETTRVMLELGLPGFVLVFLTRLMLVVVALRAALTLRSGPYRAMALALGSFFLIHLFGAVIFNPTANLYYWFAAGMLFLLHRFDREAGESARMRQRPIAQPARVARDVQWQRQR